MSISYANDEAPVIYKRTPLTLVGLMVANATFSFVILFSWRLVELFVSEPLSWATWVPVYRGSSYEDIFRYPFVVLWLWPLIGIFGAWISLKTARFPLAFAFASTPVAVLALVFGWFYLTPQGWH